MTIGWIEEFVNNGKVVDGLKFLNEETTADGLGVWKILSAMIVGGILAIGAAHVSRSWTLAGR